MSGMGKTEDTGGADSGARSPVLTRGDVVEVTIEKLVAGGDGLARHEGLPVFVARTAPGDRVRVKVASRKSSYARAEVVEILDPGAGRREPPCRHFGQCGGCDLQHLEDELQLEYKVAATLETLERIGRVELPEHEVIAGSAWGYRGRTQLHVGQTLEEDGRGPAVGYHERGSHSIVALRECPVLVPDLEGAARRLGASLPAPAPPRVDLAVGDDGALTAAPRIEGLPHGEVNAFAAGCVYAFDARCFFQGNRDLLERLVEVVVGEDAGDLAVDLYAGVGLFALPLAGRYSRVVAVEGDRLAARYGRINARRNSALNVDVVHQAVESWIPELSPELRSSRRRSAAVGPATADSRRPRLSPAARAHVCLVPSGGSGARSPSARRGLRDPSPHSARPLPADRPHRGRRTAGRENEIFRGRGSRSNDLKTHPRGLGYRSVPAAARRS